jgi:hypothetical protein
MAVQTDSGVAIQNTYTNIITTIIITYLRVLSFQRLFLGLAEE